MLLGACPEADPVDFAKTLDAAGKKVGDVYKRQIVALLHKADEVIAGLWGLFREEHRPERCV